MSRQAIKPAAGSTPTSLFISMGLDMSWRLALVVLIPVIGGVELDKAVKSAPLFLFVGLALALAGTILVLWRALQTANKLPVPKLSTAEKREVQKRYEEDDADV